MRNTIILPNTKVIYVMIFWIISSFVCCVPVSAFTPPNSISIELDETSNYTHDGYDKWYFFSMVRGEGFSIYFTPHINSGSMTFAIYDMNNNRLDTSSSVSNGKTVTLSKRTYTTGSYYIKVSGSSSAGGNYDLCVYNAWFNAGVYDEMRDRCSTNYTAFYLRSTSYQVSAIKSERYRFIAQQGSQISLGVTPHLNSGSLYISIYDVNWNKIAYRSGSISNGKTGTLSKKVYATGVYYLAVDGSSSAAGSYDVAVQGIDPMDGDTDEDGLSDSAEYYWGTNVHDADTDCDSVSDYEELLAGGKPTVNNEFSSDDIAFAVSRGGAVDAPYYDDFFNAPYAGRETWYSFYLNAGEGIVVFIVPHLHSGSLSLSMYDMNGTRIDYISSSIGSDEYRFLSKAVSTEGSYYIRISGSSSASGDYDLALLNSWINADVIMTAVRQKYHPSFYLADYIKNGSYEISRFKREIYRFNGQANSQVAFSVTAHINSGSLGSIAIYDSMFNKIAYRSSSISDGNTAVLSKTLNVSGIYYLGLEASSSALGYYNISVSGADPPPVARVSPNSTNTYSPGSKVTIEWAPSENTNSWDPITISMKRDSVPACVSEPDGANWFRFAESAENDGIEEVTIPDTVAAADDWRFYVNHNGSHVWDSSDQTFTLTGQ